MSYTLVRYFPIPVSPYLTLSWPDLKPENVLIYIPEVESVIQSELALQSSSPSTSRSIEPHEAQQSKLTGVPASTGRGGNLTPGPRHHRINVNITGSQPLPSASPSGSFVSLSSLSSGGSGRAKATGDKWGLGMVKISNDASTAQGKGKGRSVDDDLDSGMSSLNLSQSAPAATTPMRVPTPPAPPLTLDLDRPGSRGEHRERVEGEEEWVEEVDTELDYEMITVKIADLGNG